MSAKDDAPQVYNGVSEADVPSAKFGWSELKPATIQIAGWISVAFLIAYNFGNHQGHVETIWLISLAVLIALGLILFAIRPELSTARTVTSHNKPVGHVEPNWTYMQKTLTGPYAELTDSQLRALNVDPATVRQQALPASAPPWAQATPLTLARPSTRSLPHRRSRTAAKPCTSRTSSSALQITAAFTPRPPLGWVFFIAFLTTLLRVAQLNAQTRWSLDSG